MAENEKLINTKINVNTTEAEKQIARLTKQVDELDKKIEKKKSVRAGSYEYLEDLREQARQLDKNSEEYKRLAEAMDTLGEEMQRFEDAEGITAMTEQQEALVQQIMQIREGEAEIAANTQEAANNTEREAEASEDVAEGTAEAATNTEKTKKEAKKAKSEFEKMGDRITRLVKNIFFFSLISKALRSILSYFGEVLNANAEWVRATNELRGAFQTLAIPLVNAVLPILLTILQVITAIISHIASAIALFFGTTLSDSAKSAQKIGAGMATGAKNAEKMKKSLAGFDQLNVLNDNDTSGGGGGGGGIKAGGASYDFVNGIKDKILQIEAIALGAMLALGLLLLFFGGPKQWPLALGLIAAGLLGIVGLVNSSDITPELKQKILDIMMIASTCALALGLILLLTGANVPLGLGLIVAGAAGMAAVIAGSDWLQNWIGRFKETLENIQTNFHKAVEALKKWWAGWKKKFSDEWNNCKENFKKGVAAIKQWWADTVERIQKAWQTVCQKVKNAWDATKAFLQSKMDAIKTYFSTKFTNIQTKVTEVWNKIKTGASDLGNKLKSYIGDKVDDVKKRFENVSTTVNNLKDKATVVFSAIKQAMEGDFLGAIKTIQDGFTTAASDVSGIESAAESLGDELNDVFGKKYSLDIETNEIRNITTNITEAWAPNGKYKVSAMASGGVIPPNREFLTLLGDNKTEAEVVSPISTMQQAMVQALEQTGYSGGGQTIQVNVDGRKLFDVMVNQNNSAVRRTGTSPLLV